MMNITKKDITDDIAFIARTLKKQEVGIPSFLSCASPGLAVLLGMPLWQFVVAYNLSTFKPIVRFDALPSIGFSFFLGFMMFITLTSMRGKYLSLPAEIRAQSLIVNLLRRKTMCYVGVWLGVNILAGVTVKLLTLSPALSSGMHLVSFVFILFIALADLGRYDLAVFSAVIKAWRDGDKLDPEQLKRLDI